MIDLYPHHVELDKEKIQEIISHMEVWITYFHGLDEHMMRKDINFLKQLLK